MVYIHPFSALIFNPYRVTLNDVLAPPYDVIDPALYRDLTRRKPYNIAHIDPPHFIYGEDFDSVLTQARRRLNEWRDAAVLFTTPEPAFYWHLHTYRDVAGHIRQRSGLICLLRVEERGYYTIAPHEDVYEDQVEQRVRYFMATGVQSSPFYMLYTDPDDTARQIVAARVRNQEPDLQVRGYDGEEHTVWYLRDEQTIHALQGFFQEVQLLIADGHHRYEAIRRLASYYPDRPSLHYALVYLANTEGNPIQLLGYHRLLRFAPGADPPDLTAHLAAHFEIEASWPLTDRAETERRYFHSTAGQRLILLDRQQGQGHLLRLRSEVYKHLRDPFEALDPILVDRFIIQEALHRRLGLTEDQYALTFQPWLDQALAAVLAGAADVAILIAPIPLQTLFQLARRGTRVPPKSTFFYPKVPAGLIMYAHGETVSFPATPEPGD